MHILYNLSNKKPRKNPLHHLINAVKKIKLSPLSKMGVAAMAAFAPIVIGLHQDTPARPPVLKDGSKKQMPLPLIEEIKEDGTLVVSKSFDTLGLLEISKNH